MTRAGPQIRGGRIRRAESGGIDTSDVVYVGVDLGWKARNPTPNGTGLCRLDGRGRVLRLALATTDTEITSFVSSSPGRTLVVGIDAPIVVGNRSGSRECELALREFGHVAHASNIPRFRGSPFFGIRGRSITDLLAKEGFVLNTERTGDSPRLVYEVYPAPAVKRLADAKTLPRYKRGRLDTRRAILKDLVAGLDDAGWVGGWMENPFPGLLEGSLSPSGKALRAAADMFDALISAVIVRRYRLGDSSFVCFGSLGSGFLVTSR